MPFELFLRPPIQHCVDCLPFPASPIIPAPLLLPKEGKDFLGQLADPLGMIFTQTSLGHVVVQDCLYFPKYGYCYVLQDYIKDYVDDIVGSKRHAKWMSYSHVNMAAVDVHKRKLVLQEGHFCSVIGYKNNAATRVVKAAIHYK